MADPLLVLRNTVLQDIDQPPIAFYDAYGAAVDSVGGCNIVGLTGSLFTKDAETNYKSKRGTGPFYTLEAVVFLVLHRDSSYTEYLQEARAQNVPVVSLVDKKELLDYLSTVGADCPYVDLSAPLVPYASFETAPSAASVEEPTSRADKLGGKPDSSGPKKPRRPVAPKGPSKAPYVPIIMPDGKRAVRIRSYDDYFHGNRDFSFAVDYAKQMVRELDELMHREEQRVKTNASLMEQISAMNVGMATPPKKSKRSLPIIIVPNAPSSLINIFNVKDFLESGTWTPPSEAKQRASSTGERPMRVHVLNKQSGREYVALDNPEQVLRSGDDWSQVMAAFLVGAKWQFKGWRWEQPVEIFQHLQGFYVHFDDLKVDGPVSTWKIHRLPLSRSRRHLDATVAMDFWKHLD